MATSALVGSLVMNFLLTLFLLLGTAIQVCMRTLYWHIRHIHHLISGLARLARRLQIVGRLREWLDKLHPAEILDKILGLGISPQGGGQRRASDPFVPMPHHTNATNPVRVPVLFSRYLSACLCSLAIALARPHPPTHALRSHILFMCATSVSLRCLDHRNEPEHTKPHSEPHSDKRQSAHARARERARVNRTRATRRSRSTHSFACIPAKNGLTIQFWSLSFEGPSRVPPLARARASCPY
jgi:hypothetical protein